MMRKWKYAVQAYKSDGTVALRTLHTTETSKDHEVMAAKNRLERCELAKVEITALYGDEKSETIYP